MGRRRRRPPVRLGAAECEALVEAGAAAGLDRVGVTSAHTWSATREVIETRREAGLAGELAFTYRRPARSTDPRRALRGAATLVVGARSYAQVVEGPGPVGAGGATTDEPPLARIARYATIDHYALLRDGLDAVAEALRDLGARAVVAADDNSLVDREAAWRAGLGWFGKSSILLSPGLGSWVVLGSVITDAVLGTDAPLATPVADGCGSCDRCLVACPTAAIVAPGVVDARRCLAALLQVPGSFPHEHRVALGDRLYGCDECQEVCPPSRAVELRTRRGAAPSAPGASAARVDARELLALGDAELMERCGRWYVPGRDPAVLRRNLLVVLGNTAAAGDPVARDLVATYRDGDDPVLAEHARWAGARIAARAADPAATGPARALAAVVPADDDGSP